MITWLRPSGTEIETNDNEATVEHCLSLGWKPIVDGEVVDIEAEAEKAIWDEVEKASELMQEAEVNPTHVYMEGHGTVALADLDASGTLFDPEKHWKNRAKDADGNWKTKKAD